MAGKRGGTGGVSRRTLPPRVVDGVGLGEDDLGDWDEGIAVLEQALDNARQGLRGVFGGVVEQDDGAGTDLGGHPLGDLTGGEVFPVQTVPVPYLFQLLPPKRLTV